MALFSKTVKSVSRPTLYLRFLVHDINSMIYLRSDDVSIPLILTSEIEDSIKVMHGMF